MNADRIVRLRRNGNSYDVVIDVGPWEISYVGAITVNNAEWLPPAKGIVDTAIFDLLDNAVRARAALSKATGG